MKRYRRIAAALMVAGGTLTAAIGLIPVGTSGAATTGVTAKAIKIGITAPLSGPVSEASGVGKGVEAYFNYVNANGGINGRKIQYQLLDDAYTPSRILDNVRQFVDNGDFAIEATGAPAVSAAKFVDESKVPMMVFAGASTFSQPKKTPYIRDWGPSIAGEGATDASLAIKADPNAKIGMIVLGNEAGTDFANGVRTVLKEKGKTSALINVQQYAPTDTTLSGYVNNIKASNPTTIIGLFVGPPGAGAVKYLRQTGFTGPVYQYSSSASRVGFLDTIGTEAVGLNSEQWMADPGTVSPSTPWFKTYSKYVKAVGNGANVDDQVVLTGWLQGGAIVAALKAAKTLTVPNFLKAWDSFKNVPDPGLYPGLTLTTTSDGRPVSTLQPVKWGGKAWVKTGSAQKIRPTWVGPFSTTSFPS